MSEKKLHRLWVTFPTEEMKLYFKQLLTKDFGSSGHGLMTLCHFYDKPHLAINMGDVRHVKEMLETTNENSESVLQLKKRLEEIEKEVMKEVKPSKVIEEIIEEEEYEY